MKRLLALSCLLVAFVCAFAQQKVTLQDVANGTYRPQNIYGIKPMLDGEHYTQISADRKRIVKFRLKPEKKWKAYSMWKPRAIAPSSRLMITSCRPMKS